jgi:hypothetical protein
VKTFIFAALAVVGTLQQRPAPTTTGTTGTADHMASASSAASMLHRDMRKLWSDHVIWTRDYIIAAVGDQPDAQAAANRLLRNQEDIGRAVADFYGKPAGDQLTTLLKQHITIAVDLISRESRRQGRSTAG